MASTVASIFRLNAFKNTGILVRNAANRSSGAKRFTQYRNAVSTSSGAILPEPVKTRFGITRVTVVIVPFLYIGTLMSKNFAIMLEEHDIFVPDDDDDD